MEKEQKIKVLRIILTVILLLAVKILKLQENYELIFLICAYIVIGYDVIINALCSLIKEFSLDETVLMTIATIGAFLLKDNFEAVFVMLFYQIGELFQDYSYDKSKGNIKNLIDIAPNTANVFNDGNVSKIDPHSINVGDILYVNPYEKIPVDGEIIEGSTMLNTSALTGESIPRYVTIGDYVASGLINNDKLIIIKAIKKFEDSTATKILDLVENATEKKSKSEKFITNFARVYTPIVCLIALLTFLIPCIYSLITNGSVTHLTDYIYRALTILVISCPCAILISVPIAFFAGLGSASKLGILIKGSNYLEALAKIKTFIFDKTGTMTKGVFEVIGIHHCKINEDDLVRYVAHIEFFSNHPIAKSILRYYGKDVDEKIVKDVREIGGRGLSGIVDGKLILVGNDKLMTDNNIEYIECSDVGTIVHVAIDNIYEGHILINDIIKENAKKSLDMLKKQGVNRIIMLTGDGEDVAKNVANELSFDEYHANLLPSDKLNIVEDVLKENKVSFVGDGINDAPCITRSDVGIAMGAIGSASVIDLADIVIMDDDVMNIPKAKKLSAMTLKIVYENIAFSIGVKILVLILSVFGISFMWLAIFADVGVMVIAVLNSIRMLYAYKFIK